MALRKLRQVEALAVPDGMEWDAPVSALERLTDVKAAKQSDRSISILEQIGERWDGSGMTAARINGMLRALGPGEVTVNINSPGGSFFDGLAIYNQLREHDGKVTVNVLGMAASAASVIAMAADELRVAKAGFLMIHNSWAVAMGNRNDLRDIADTLTKFDGQMAALYADRSGIDKAKIAKMMDAETYLSGEEAISMGLADGLLASDEVAPSSEGDATAAIRRMEIALAKAGVPRSERRQLFRETFGTPSAAEPAKPRAGNELVSALTEAIHLFK